MNEPIESPRIQRLELSGYRPFDAFSAEPGELTVIIGANASGKSSFFDFLRFISFAAQNPLPPEIDPQSAGKMLFHSGGPERISFALTVDMHRTKPLRYEVDIQGPVGVPVVTRERLTGSIPFGAKRFVIHPFVDFTMGMGMVQERAQAKLPRPPWSVPPNELALRRALDPTLTTVSGFQNYLASWRFYSGFDVSACAALRRPVPSEPNPTLADDGANLSAVLNWIMLEHPDAWQEIETHLRASVKGFRSLSVKPRGGPGTVIGTWREEGIKDELTLADLSDGTLRLLCWLALTLSPSLPPLICIDEPELGLHPRVLPVLAGALRFAAARSQVLIATHSPYFLSQFSLDEIAVMRKENGRAVFVRPATSEALRGEVAELGEEALIRLHLSEELEVLP